MRWELLTWKVETVELSVEDLIRRLNCSNVMMHLEALSIKTKFQTNVCYFILVFFGAQLSFSLKFLNPLVVEIESLFHILLAVCSVVCLQFCILYLVCNHKLFLGNIFNSQFHKIHSPSFSIPLQTCNSKHRSLLNFLKIPKQPKQ